MIWVSTRTRHCKRDAAPSLFMGVAQSHGQFEVGDGEAEG